MENKPLHRRASAYTSLEHGGFLLFHIPSFYINHSELYGLFLIRYDDRGVARFHNTLWGRWLIGSNVGHSLGFLSSWSICTLVITWVIISGQPLWFALFINIISFEFFFFFSKFSFTRHDAKGTNHHCPLFTIHTPTISPADAHSGRFISWLFFTIIFEACDVFSGIH